MALSAGIEPATQPPEGQVRGLINNENSLLALKLHCFQLT